MGSRALSLPATLGWAAAAHVFVGLAVLAAPLARTPGAVAEESSEAFVEITSAVETSAPEEPHASVPSAPMSRGERWSGAVAARAPTAASGAAPVDDATPGDAAWFDPVRALTARPTLIDRPIITPATPLTAESRPRDDAAITAVRDALDAHDQSLGLGRAGPLQAAAQEAASATVAPDTGVGELVIDCDGDGHVVAVRAVQSDWQPVATRLARVMAGKTMRVRPGRHGLRVKLRIVAERTPPAGRSQPESSAGAVPDEVCDGQGLTRRCVAGMPFGVSGKGRDLSNLGARPGRVVHVTVDGETDL